MCHSVVKIEQTDSNLNLSFDSLYDLEKRIA